MTIANFVEIDKSFLTLFEFSLGHIVSEISSGACIPHVGAKVAQAPVGAHLRRLNSQSNLLPAD